MEDVALKMGAELTFDDRWPLSREIEVETERADVTVAVMLGDLCVEDALAPSAMCGL